MSGSAIERYAGTAKCLSVLILALAAAAPRPAFGQVPEASSWREWSAEVADALTAYRAGQYEAAQRICARLRARPGQGKWRVDAEAIEAMCLMRMPGRSDRIDGRVRLRQLAQDHPDLLREPECNLAYGIALTALSETAKAIDFLDLAGSRFGQRGLQDRQAEALVALAEAWARHGEWEMTPPRFKVPRPRTPEDANAVRRSQIEAVRARLEALPNQDEALDRLDLILAEHIIATGDAPGEGLAIYSRLAAAEKLTPGRVEAAMRLAHHYESVEQYAQALRLYQRVAHDARGIVASEAQARTDDIVRPQIEIEAPESVAVSARVPISLRVRGLDSVQFEVRRVDVDQWLGDLRTRAREALLPESGSLRVSAELKTRASVAFGWWKSDRLEEPLRFSGEPGAYVVLVRGRDAEGRWRTAKKLVVVTDLWAVCLVGPEHAVVWATWRPGAPPAQASEPLVGRFWMNRSFMPTRFNMDRGVGRFRLPNEARVMRDKGWVCLVRAGKHVAVCRGRLPVGGAAQNTPKTAMVCGPPTVPVGQTLYVSGVLLPSASGELELPDDATVEISVLDAAEKKLFAGLARLSTAGAFAVQVPVTAEFADRHVRVLARYDGRALENVMGPPTAFVPATATPSFDVRIEVPTWLPSAEVRITGQVVATFPWGDEPIEARANCRFDAVQLPTTECNDWVAQGKLVTREGRLDERGRLALDLSPTEFDLVPGPLAVRATATVASWEGRQGTARREITIGTEPVHAWLTYEPPESVVGGNVRCHVGWFKPGGLPVVGNSQIIVRRDGIEIERLALRPDRDGLTSKFWRPDRPGTFDLGTELEVYGEAPLSLNTTVSVAARDPSNAQSADSTRCAAAVIRQGGKPAARVGVEAGSPRPLLAVIEDGDPLAAGVVDGRDAPVEVVLPLESEPAHGTRVVILSVGEGGFGEVAAASLSPAPAESLGIELSLADGEVRPATTAVVHVKCGPRALPGGTTLTGRLIEVARQGFTFDPTEPLIEPSETRGPELTVVPSAGSVPRLSARPRAEEALILLLSDGPTLWTTSIDAGDGRAVLHVPIPDAAGLYGLVVTAREPGGEVNREMLVLDARRGLRVSVDTAPRLTSGDRSRLDVLVENGGLKPTEVEIDWNADECLRASPGSVFVDGGGSPLAAGTPTRVTIAPGRRARLSAEVTAVRPGRGRAHVDALAEGRTYSAECEYEVVAPLATADGDEAIRITRTVLLWTELMADTRDESGKVVEQGEWDWLPIDADTCLVPGRLLKVREELFVPATEHSVRWSQRFPPTCFPASAAYTPAETVGRRQPGTADELVYHVSTLKAGSHVREYLMAVVRPGVCCLPVPKLCRGEHCLPVSLTPGEVLLTVVEPGACH